MAGTTWRDPPRAMAEQLDTDKLNDLPPEPAKGLLHSSALVGGATLVSRVLGLVRDVVLANLVGATSNADAFVMQCPNGCFSVDRHRRKSGLVCATCKASVEFMTSNSGM